MITLVELPAARTGRTKVGELISAGVVSAPAEIEVTFKGQRFTATIEADGLIHFDGQTYSSPSHAGGMVRNKVNGPPPDGRPYWSTNGWTFWHYKDPVTGHPEPISKWLERLGDLDSRSCWPVVVAKHGRSVVVVLAVVQP